jgi:hypothetical protein
MAKKSRKTSKAVDTKKLAANDKPEVEVKLAERIGNSLKRNGHKYLFRMNRSTARPSSPPIPHARPRARRPRQQRGLPNSASQSH